MNFTQDVLLVLLIGVIAAATDTDLATNTNILLLILLFLSSITAITMRIYPSPI